MLREEEDVEEKEEEERQEDGARTRASRSDASGIPGVGRMPFGPTDRSGSIVLGGGGGGVGGRAGWTC